MLTTHHTLCSIEEVAAKDPSAIITVPIDFDNGLSLELAKETAVKLGFKPESQEKAADIFIKLYKLFKERDATQIEINPLAEVEGGDVLCMDAKLGFDENAEFRQEKVFSLRDFSQEDKAEVEAAKYGLNFIKLDGSIGCLVNGAGLAMATMDVLSLAGGSPANFLDVGGGATAQAVKKAFELLLADPKVKSIFVNIFGGIMRCDVIAEGIILAAKVTTLTLAAGALDRADHNLLNHAGARDDDAADCPPPGNQGDRGQEVSTEPTATPNSPPALIADLTPFPSSRLIQESGMKIFSYDGLDEAADAAVKAAQ